MYVLSTRLRIFDVCTVYEAENICMYVLSTRLRIFDVCTVYEAENI